MSESEGRVVVAGAEVALAEDFAMEEQSTTDGNQSSSTGSPGGDKMEDDSGLDDPMRSGLAMLKKTEGVADPLCKILPVPSRRKRMRTSDVLQEVDKKFLLDQYVAERNTNQNLVLMGRIAELEKELKAKDEAATEKERLHMETLALAEAQYKGVVYGEVGRLLDSEFGCSICNEVFIEPAVLSCGHTFCSYCITRALEGDSQCPVCRTGTHYEPPEKNIEMRNFITKVYQLMPEEMRTARQQLETERAGQQLPANRNGNAAGNRRQRSRSDSPFLDILWGLSDRPSWRRFEIPRFRRSRSRSLDRAANDEDNWLSWSGSDDDDSSEDSDGPDQDLFPSYSSRDSRPLERLSALTDRSARTRDLGSSVGSRARRRSRSPSWMFSRRRESRSRPRARSPSFFDILDGAMSRSGTSPTSRRRRQTARRVSHAATSSGRSSRPWGPRRQGTSSNTNNSNSTNGTGTVELSWPRPLPSDRDDTNASSARARLSASSLSRLRSPPPPELSPGPSSRRSLSSLINHDTRQGNSSSSAAAPEPLRHDHSYTATSSNNGTGGGTSTSTTDNNPRTVLLNPDVFRERLNRARELVANVARLSSTPGSADAGSGSRARLTPILRPSEPSSLALEAALRRSSRPASESPHTPTSSAATSSRPLVLVGGAPILSDIMNQSDRYRNTEEIITRIRNSRLEANRRTGGSSASNDLAGGAGDGNSSSTTTPASSTSCLTNPDRLAAIQRFVRELGVRSSQSSASNTANITPENQASTNDSGNASNQPQNTARTSSRNFARRGRTSSGGRSRHPTIQQIIDLENDVSDTE